MTALHWAAVSGRPDMAAELLEQDATVDARDAANATPLMLAAVQAEEMLARLLLDHKAKVNLRNSNGMTAWIMSAHYLDLAT